MSLVNYKAKNHPQQTDKRGARDDVDDRGTDQAFFDALSERFGGFTLDVAASENNAKCARFYTVEDNGLDQRWTGAVWCNPPYSDLRSWIEKAWTEWNLGAVMGGGPVAIVMLVPANRTEQAWWQDGVEPYRDQGGSLTVEFLRGRMRFDRPGWTKPAKGDRPPFGCCLLIWGPR